MLAHIGGMPVEELLPSAAGVGGTLLAARAWLALWLRRLPDDHEDDDNAASAASSSASAPAARLSSR
jgi:hypothetical protein